MITRNESETIALGETLGLRLCRGCLVALEGDLGGGKTTFTKGIGKALNVKEIINSPTFTILKIYKGDIDLYHIDAYRLENNDYDLGIEELARDDITVVEWPQFYQKYLPADYIIVNFRYIDEKSRKITFSCKGDKYRKIIEGL